MFGLMFIFFINSPEEGVNNVFMEFRCQNENCGCQSWKRAGKREAQGSAALAKIRQSLRVVPLGDSGQEMRHKVVLCFHV